MPSEQEQAMKVGVLFFRMLWKAQQFGQVHKGGEALAEERGRGGGEGRVCGDG